MPDAALTTTVKKWLDESGYPLEMRVAVAFQKAGFRVFQSDFFADPDTAEQRETDVVAMTTTEIDGLLIRFVFLVECKVSKSYPWILFLAHGHGLAKPALVAQRAANGYGRSILKSVCQLKEVHKLPLFKTSSPPAYGMTEALAKGGNNTCFKAAMSVAKAALAHSQEHTKSRFTLQKLATIYMPLIVLDGHLFETLLDVGTNEPSLSETDGGLLIWRNPVAGPPHTLIHVITENGLDEFTKKASSSCDSFFAICKDNIKEIREGLKTDKDYLPKGFL